MFVPENYETNIYLISASIHKS